MKAFWREHFHIPADSPISEHVFMARFTLEICLILLYLFCMAYAAYALFQSGQTVVL